MLLLTASAADSPVPQAGPRRLAVLAFKSEEATAPAADMAAAAPAAAADQQQPDPAAQLQMPLNSYDQGDYGGYEAGEIHKYGRSYARAALVPRQICGLAGGRAVRRVSPHACAGGASRLQVPSRRRLMATRAAARAPPI